MARIYTPTTKENFLNEVKKIMENEEFPYEMPSQILKDLGKIDFDFENYTGFDEESGFSIYPIGHRELSPGFHVFFWNAGGDWEFPICIIFYYGKDNKIRGYIPKEGNAWNKSQKCAYGSGEGEEDEEKAENAESEIDENLMIKEILNHITKKDE